ncbi:MAG TPA: hypothetical protein VHC22_33610 [Pirellulales bacterium]|nr:hypothetical protein [Pirellulales bacterium]
MPRQFSLKALLVWLVLLPPAAWAFAVSFNSTDELQGLLLLFTAGALVGASVGSCKSCWHAAFGALLGMVLAWPLAFVVLVLLLYCGLVDIW